MSMIPIGIGWLAGMWAAFTFELPTEPLLITVGIPLIAVVLWRDSPRTRLLLIALLAFLLGALRVTTARPVFDANDLATYNDQGVVTVTGVVDDYPDQRDQSVNLRIRAETLERRVSGESADAMMIEGMLLVRAPRLPEYRYGDRIEIRGTLQTPPEFATFSYRDYLAGQGIHSIIDQPRIDLLEHDQGSPILAAIFDLKDRAHDTIAHILPEPQASLLTGIMLGDEGTIPPIVKEDFRITGTSHIIAISGYNFAVLISIMAVPATRLFGRRRAFPILVLAIWSYTVLVGANAAVVRAAVMGALALWATYLGRQSMALNSLFVAAFIMTFLDPFTLGDMGFQLSFAATLGLVLYTNPLQDAAERGLTRLFSTDKAKQIVALLSDAIIVTVAAQITTLPLLIVTFRQVSILTLLVNALVLPAQTGVMMLGGLALLAGMVLLPLGQIIAWSAWLFLTYTIQTIHLFAQVPGISMELGYVDPLWGVAYVIILGCITYWFSRSAEQRIEIKARLKAALSLRMAMPAFGIIAMLSAVALSWQPDNQLHVHALNVDGAPVFVQTPTGQQILIGGSNSPSTLLAALGARLPFWDRDIDLIVVSRGDSRSLNGLLAIVDRYHVSHILSVDLPDNRTSREWLDVLDMKSIEVLEGGASVGIEEGLSLSLDEMGWVQIDTGSSSVGIGTPHRDSRADVLITERMTDEDERQLRSLAPQLVVMHEASEVMLDGAILIINDSADVELIFDGAEWAIQASR